MRLIFAVAIISGAIQIFGLSQFANKFRSHHDPREHHKSVEKSR
jgi:hypothetical protein